MPQCRIAVGRELQPSRTLRSRNVLGYCLRWNRIKGNDDVSFGGLSIVLLFTLYSLSDIILLCCMNVGVCVCVYLCELVSTCARKSLHVCVSAQV